MKQIIQMEHNMVCEFQLVRGEPVGYFTRVAKDFNLGLPRTNPASSLGRNWTQVLEFTSQALKPLSHTASYANHF